MVIFGNPAQLPLIQRNSLWIDIATGSDLLGYLLNHQFIDIMILTENNRLDKYNPNAVEFQSFLSRLRHSENIEGDWNVFKKEYSYCIMDTNC